MGGDAERIKEQGRGLDEVMALAKFAEEIAHARKAVIDASLELCNASLRRLNVAPGQEGDYRQACAEVLRIARTVETAAATLRRLGDRMAGDPGLAGHRVAADDVSVGNALALATKSREGIEVHIRRSLEEAMALAELEVEMTTARKALVDAGAALSDSAARRLEVDRGRAEDYRKACAEVLKLARAVETAAATLRRLGGRSRGGADKASVDEAVALATKCRGQVEIPVRVRIWWSRVPI
jgi:hypothetical protein